MKRHIERVIQLYFLDETRESMKNAKFTEKQLWNFNYGDHANLAPHPTRTLKLSEVLGVVDDAYPLQTLEAEELSNEGTKTWLRNIFRQQLAQGDNTLAKILVLIYGDLGTIKAIHSTKSHMAEELHDTDSFKCAVPSLGVFHLRKRLLELIIKEFRGKGCPDFAHLDPMIKKVNMKGFKDDKCEHFRQVEDLVLLSYRSLVSACIVEYLPIPGESDDLTATERRDHAALQMMDMGKDKTREEVVGHVYRAMFNPLSEYIQSKKHFPESPLFNEQMIQASQLVRLGGLYIELKDTIRFGRVGKFPFLFRLLLPWFAGSGNGAPIYTRELAAFLLQQRYMDPNTFDSMLDNLLRPACLSGWIEADMACEHLVRIQKDIYKARGGSFRWEKLLKHTSLISRTLYNAKVAFAFGHLSTDKIKKRGSHYDKTQVPDILSIMGEILNSGLLRLDDPKKINIENNDLWNLGIQDLQTYDMAKLKAYIVGKDNFGEDDEINYEPSPSWDLRGAVDGDPDNIEDFELSGDREESMEPTFAEIQRQEAARKLEALRRQGVASGVIRPAISL
jgi:hypothetical protein